MLEHFPREWRGVIAGAGKLFPHSRINLPNSHVRVLRGALSAQDFRGDFVLGDPGLLVTDLLFRPEPIYDVGIVPHWSDDSLGQKFQGRIILPNQSPLRVIHEIASCKQIVSSSLHGLITADAFGIPRRAELFPKASREGGSFKYQDYASALGEVIEFGKVQEVSRTKVESIQAAVREVLRDLVSSPLLDQ